MAVALFWISVSILAYTLFVFPALIILRAWIFPKPWRSAEITPQLSVVIAAYNEAKQIAQRIENVLSCDYPPENLEIIIASDGSTDETNEIVRRYADRNVRLVPLSRRGKGQVLNAAIPQATGELLVFSDANTEFAPDALRNLVRPFADPQVGGVAGNQIYLRDERASRTADGEQVYWSLDTKLRQFQSRAGNVTSATGAILAIRKSLYQTVPADAMDDFIISTGVIVRGFRLVFAGDARAFEPVAVQDGVEFSRKRRVITQGLRAVMHQRCLLNPFRYKFYAIQLFTHKVLRRLLILPALAIVCTSPLLWSQGLVYQATALAQAGFLACAAWGWFFNPRWLGRQRILMLPYYLCMVNGAALVALANTLAGRRIRRWEPERNWQFETERSLEASETISQ